MASVVNISKGSLLIAEPFLSDPNFERGVILLCEHNEQGSFGFVLNQATELMLGDVLEETIYQDIPLYLGGPVEKNTLHFIHCRPDLIEGGIEIGENVYWGGDFEQVKTLINVNQLTNEDLRFFVGYSGWGSGQLLDELLQKTWIVSQTSSDFLFSTPANHFWREVLKNMGGKYRSIAHYPIDPSLN
ncbi:YqgE/AlgH family protein [Telluribacter sp. SYSU D00476]|uniref:YqgE/AlgH family protein n=1 Tax=Telluribacter sp. SYSU D00476 TaxID=2811430 RepID=UPI001FF57BC9|nr:YqgE/AlgH family protein [Telluribacter sp. SYSU D00476]